MHFIFLFIGAFVQCCSQKSGKEEEVKTVLSVGNIRPYYNIYSVSQMHLVWNCVQTFADHVRMHTFQMNTIKRYVCLWSNWIYCKHPTDLHHFLKRHGHWSCSHSSAAVLLFSTFERSNCGTKLSFLESGFSSILLFRLFYCRCCTLWARKISTNSSNDDDYACF